LLLTLTGCTTLIPKDEPPDLSCPDCNVIFLNIELLRADYIGLISNEHGDNITPNIDKFFEDGIIFEDASAPAGSTQMSNIEVLTNTDPMIIKGIINFYKDKGSFQNLRLHLKMSIFL